MQIVYLHTIFVKYFIIFFWFTGKVINHNFQNLLVDEEGNPAKLEDLEG